MTSCPVNNLFTYRVQGDKAPPKFPSMLIRVTERPLRPLLSPIILITYFCRPAILQKRPLRWPAESCGEVPLPFSLLAISPASPKGGLSVLALYSKQAFSGLSCVQPVVCGESTPFHLPPAPKLPRLHPTRGALAKS